MKPDRNHHRTENLLFLFLLCSLCLTGCSLVATALDDAMPQINKVTVLEKNATLQKNKNVAVLITIPKFTPKAYHEFKTIDMVKALNELGISQYKIIEDEQGLSDTYEYLLKIEVENWTAKDEGEWGSRLWAAATSTMYCTKTGSLLVRVGGDASDHELGYDIGETIAALLVAMLNAMYS